MNATYNHQAIRSLVKCHFQISESIPATTLTFVSHSASSDYWFYWGDNCGLSNANKALYSWISRDLQCVTESVWVCIFLAYNDASVFVSCALLLSALPQVMRETDTQVKWPSKLKIGAKSKKGDKLYKYFSYDLAAMHVLAFLCSHKVILPIY